MNLSTKPEKKGLVKFIMCCFFIFVASSGLFAAGTQTIAVLDTAGDKIYDILTATWLKVLFAVALCIEFGVIAFGNAQGEGGTVKKVLPWIIGTAGCLGATSIVKFFFDGIEVEKITMALPVLEEEVVNTINYFV